MATLLSLCALVVEGLAHLLQDLGLGIAVVSSWPHLQQIPLILTSSAGLASEGCSVLARSYWFTGWLVSSDAISIWCWIGVVGIQG